MAKIGVVLSGCGVNDGSEIHEAVITMLELDKAGAEMVLMAPNIDQLHVINHATGEEMDDSRNVLIESARIARGNIEDIAVVTSDNIDALILPGGFGVAKNLSDFDKNKNYKFIKGDIGDKKKVKFILEKFKPDAVINFAAETHVDRSIDNPSTFINTNILGVYNLLNNSLEYWNKIKKNKKKFKFIQISTDEVTDLLIKENQKNYH